MVRHDARGIFVRVILAATLVVVSAVAQAGWAEGYNAENSGDYPLALKEYRQSAEQGYIFSYVSLGDMYAKGKGVPQDHKLATSWYLKAVGLYRKAAQQGDVSAEFYLGSMYQQGQGVPRDLKQALSWYRKAAKHGQFSAAASLGAMYMSGEGVPIDLVQAYKWYDLAASANDQTKEMYLQIRDNLKKKMTPTQIEEVGRVSDQPKGNCKNSRQLSDAKYTTNLPSEASAEQAFKNENKDWFEKGLLCIESFKKTDGQKMSVFGVDYYKLEYEAVVSFPKGTDALCITWSNNPGGAPGIGHFYQCGMRNENVSPSGRPVRVSGTISFEKTEKGWRSK